MEAMPVQIHVNLYQAFSSFVKLIKHLDPDLVGQIAIFTRELITLTAATLGSFIKNNKEIAMSFGQIMVRIPFAKLHWNTCGPITVDNDSTTAEDLEKLHSNAKISRRRFR